MPAADELGQVLMYACGKLIFLDRFYKPVDSLGRL